MIEKFQMKECRSRVKVTVKMKVLFESRNLKETDGNRLD